MSLLSLKAALSQWFPLILQMQILTLPPINLFSQPYWVPSTSNNVYTILELTFRYALPLAKISSTFEDLSLINIPSFSP